MCTCTTIHLTCINVSCTMSVSYSGDWNSCTFNLNLNVSKNLSSFRWNIFQAQPTVVKLFSCTLICIQNISVLKFLGLDVLVMKCQSFHEDFFWDMINLFVHDSLHGSWTRGISFLHLQKKLILFKIFLWYKMNWNS